jgi:hypothetical protein
MPDLFWTACRSEKRCGVFRGKRYECPMCGGKVEIRDLSELYGTPEPEPSPEMRREREGR